MPAKRLNFNMEMHHYDVVPGQLQERIIEKAKAERGEVKEEEEWTLASFELRAGALPGRPLFFGHVRGQRIMGRLILPR